MGQPQERMDAHHTRGPTDGPAKPPTAPTDIARELEEGLVCGLWQSHIGDRRVLRAIRPHLSPADFLDPRLGTVYATLLREDLQTEIDVRRALEETHRFTREDFVRLNLDSSAPILDPPSAAGYARRIHEEAEKRSLRHEIKGWLELLDREGLERTQGAIRTRSQTIDEALASAAFGGTFLAAWKSYEDVLGDSREAPASIIGDGLLRPRQFGILFGPPGTGKSWVALDLLVCVAQGQDWLGCIPTMPCRCAMISLELEAWDLKKRLMAVVMATHADEQRLMENLVLMAPPDFDGRLDILDPKARGAIKQSIRSLGIRLLVIDTLARSHSADEFDLREVSAAILEIIRECECAILFVHHARKPPQGMKVRSTQAEMRGDSRLAADSRLIVGLERKGHLVRLTVEKTNTGSATEPMWLAADKDTGALLPTDGPQKAQDQAASKRSEILRAVDPAGPEGMSKEEIAAEVNLPVRTIQRHLSRLVADGFLVRTGKANRTRYFTSRATGESGASVAQHCVSDDTATEMDF